MEQLRKLEEVPVALMSWYQIRGSVAFRDSPWRTRLHLLKHVVLSRLSACLAFPSSLTCKEPMFELLEWL